MKKKNTVLISLPILLDIFLSNSHIVTATFPLSTWRTHCIIPVFKTGNHAVISNYFPISLLCIYYFKVFEKNIFKETTHFVSNSFTPQQFGFLPGRSTLLLFINELLDAKLKEITRCLM